MSVGIEAISFDVPQHYIDMKELAQARNVDPDKYLLGLGQKEMAVATPCEDTVTLAANAGWLALNDYGIDPQEIGLVAVGTETAVDHSKPVSSYVHRLLNLSTQSRVIEMKHACYGAMAGMSLACDWILSGRNQGKKALVIASDIARYGLHSPGEPTQGAGAVALVVSDEPRLLELETQYQGVFAKEVMDFWRPLYTSEAVVDGHYSIECYLQALRESLAMYQQSYDRQNAEISAPLSDRFLACLYHVPFVKMARKAHFQFLESSWGTSLEKESESYNKALIDYKERVDPYLNLNARVGNIYTGSLFLSLLNLLADAGDSMKDQFISLFSYGSGCGSEFMSGRIKGSCDQQVNYPEKLGQRQKVSIEWYESAVEGHKEFKEKGSCVVDPEQWGVKKRFAFLGVKDHKRIYGD